MKNKLLLAAFAILYQVYQSNSWVNLKLDPFKNLQSLERTNYQVTHDDHGEISIKREGGLKKIVSLSNKSSDAKNKKINHKKQKLHELRRLRKSRSNETNENFIDLNSNKDIKKLRMFITDYDLKHTQNSSFNKNKTNENFEETNSKVKTKEELKDTNSSYEYKLHLQPISVKEYYTGDKKEINSNNRDQNQTMSYKDHRKQNHFRHLWGQDRSIHSYRSASMHKKPYWYSPYHFPRAKVTVAGLNIPWFRLRSTFSDQVLTESVSISNSEHTFPKQQNNSYKLSTTPDPFKILETKISNHAEPSKIPVNRTNFPSPISITLQPRFPHWPNFYKNRDNYTSEKSVLIYKSIKVGTKAEGVETDKTTIYSNTKAWIAASPNTTKVNVKEHTQRSHTNSRQDLIETTTGNTGINFKAGSKVERTTANSGRSSKLQNVMSRVFSTALAPLREPQWPPWPQWLNEPLQKNKKLYNGSYILNEYTANVYSFNDKSVTLNVSSFNVTDATETTKSIEKSELFYDIENSYKGVTANIAVSLPATTERTVVATTEAQNYMEQIDEKGSSGYYSDSNSNILPNLRNIVRCTQACPLTPEFNPICGTDDITYTNPGRLLCLQFCGLDVRVKKYQPCSSKHKLSEYPNMINLFLNTAVESLKATVKSNVSFPKRTVKAYYASTPSPTKSTTVFYGRYDSFTMNDEDEESADAKAVTEKTTELALRYPFPIDTTVVTSPPISVESYIEKLKHLINYSTYYEKRSQSTTTNDLLSQFKDVTHSSKKIESNLAALNNMLKHQGRDASTKHTVHAVTYSSRDVGTKLFTVTRAIKDASSKKFKINIATNARNSASTKNNLIYKHGTPRVDALDTLDEPNNNGRRFVESPFVDLPYSSSEYISPDENNIDIFQDNQKESDDTGEADGDNKFWGYPSEKEIPDTIEDIKVKEKTQ